MGNGSKKYWDQKNILWRSKKYYQDQKKLFPVMGGECKEPTRPYGGDERSENPTDVGKRGPEDTT